MKAKVIILAALLCGTNGATNITDEEHLYTFNAAVIEYLPIRRNGSVSAEESLNINTQNYINLLKSVTQDVDLIMFPESTLSSGIGVSAGSEVPPPFTEIICNSSDSKYQNYLKAFSCAAIEHNTTVIVNIIERENCTLNNATGFCPTSGIIHYNSNVAFNESGGVSGRYRKWNLFGEYDLSQPSEVEVVTIKTKNNNSFGIFTCFDILFPQPALNLTRDLGLKNILFPTMWFSELPFLTALQTQQMWAEENNVNLLSAGANDPRLGSGGTGVFIGDLGPLEYDIISGEGGSRVIIQSVPRPEIENNSYRVVTPIEEDTDILAEEMDSFFLLTDTSIYNYTSVILNTSKTSTFEEVCDGEGIRICCQFAVNISVNQSINNVTDRDQYSYHLVAFNGVRSFSGVRDGGLELCGLLACLNDSISSCGRRFSNYSTIVWPITFENISIVANFTKDENRIQFPNSLLSSIRPLSPQYTTWETQELNNTVKRTYSITKPQNKLLTFGIYGRDFNRDSSLNVPGGKSAKLFNINILVLLCSILLCSKLVNKLICE